MCVQRASGCMHARGQGAASSPAASAGSLGEQEDLRLLDRAVDVDDGRLEAPAVAHRVRHDDADVVQPERLLRGWTAVRGVGLGPTTRTECVRNRRCRPSQLRLLLLLLLLLLTMMYERHTRQTSSGIGVLVDCTAIANSAASIIDCTVRQLHGFRETLPPNGLTGLGGLMTGV